MTDGPIRRLGPVPRAADLASDGTALGIEIRSPARLDLSALNEVLQRLGQMPVVPRYGGTEMPYFSVMLHASEIHVTGLNDGGTPAGFFTTRLVRAKDAIGAEEKAKSSVQLEWTEGEFALANRGGAPVLSVESVHPVTLWRWLRFKNKGYSFYRSKPPED